jgi:hypothetical protein
VLTAMRASFGDSPSFAASTCSCPTPLASARLDSAESLSMRSPARSRASAAAVVAVLELGRQRRRINCARGFSASTAESTSASDSHAAERARLSNSESASDCKDACEAGGWDG